MWYISPADYKTSLQAYVSQINFIFHLIFFQICMSKVSAISKNNNNNKRPSLLELINHLKTKIFKILSQFLPTSYKIFVLLICLISNIVTFKVVPTKLTWEEGLLVKRHAGASSDTSIETGAFKSFRYLKCQCSYQLGEWLANFIVYKNHVVALYSKYKFQAQCHSVDLCVTGLRSQDRW